jgi:uncharacterized protein (TIGR03083 family)
VVDAQVAALRSSVARLRGVVSRLDDADLTRRSYATEWTIADVLSHLGSGAVITQRRLEDVLAGAPTPDDFAPGVWDEWNAKTPGAQRDDALAADAALLARVEAVTSEEAGALTFAMGPMTLDFAGFVGMRLNEHAMHVWDIEVVGDPPRRSHDRRPRSSSTTSTSSPASPAGRPGTRPRSPWPPRTHAASSPWPWSRTPSRSGPAPMRGPRTSSCRRRRSSGWSTAGWTPSTRHRGRTALPSMSCAGCSPGRCRRGQRDRDAVRSRASRRSSA